MILLDMFLFDVYTYCFVLFVFVGRLAIHYSFSMIGLSQFDFLVREPCCYQLGQISFAKCDVVLGLR